MSIDKFIFCSLSCAFRSLLYSIILSHYFLNTIPFKLNPVHIYYNIGPTCIYYSPFGQHRGHGNHYLSLKKIIFVSKIS